MARSAQASAKMRPPDMLCSPKRCEILSGERSQSARADLLDAAAAGDAAVLRRARIARGRPALVVVDERAGLRAIDLEALSHRVRAIVIALDQRRAAQGGAPLD